ncbi:MAG: hypothetical protein ACFBSE_05755 [Prochloraceae cyanobacterium]
MRETFIVARTVKTNISDRSLAIAEKKVIKDTQWWTLPEIQNTEETILPGVLMKLMSKIISRQYGELPEIIDLSPIKK